MNAITVGNVVAHVVGSFPRVKILIILISGILEIDDLVHIFYVRVCVNNVRLVNHLSNVFFVFTFEIQQFVLFAEKR